MDTTNIAIVVAISVISFFVGMQAGEYKVKAEGRAAVAELVKGFAK